MARHPTMRTPDGKWTVEIITVRGKQSFRVKNLHSIPKGTIGSRPGRVVKTTDELRRILGDAFETLVEDRSGRFDGGR